MFYICDIHWVPACVKTHTDNQGNWVDLVAEQNYISISLKPQTNEAVMVLQLACIRKRWESGEDGTGGWGINLLQTRP
ncbi:hypothetical protein HanPI659440_Chr14g0527491 [Helianthus annuus]|nr:hypothetical protein HanPI659440_Chr14g0527491 [Helianthus annuus]